MSIENALKFVAEVGKDESLKAALEGADLETLMESAKERGLEFSTEHLQQVCEHLCSDQELDLEALDEVSGGFFGLILPIATSGADMLIKNAPKAMAALFGGRGG